METPDPRNALRDDGDSLVTTERLTLRRLDERDADFLVTLLNDERFLRFIGDRGVRNRADALVFLDNAARYSYARYGFGPWLVSAREGGEALGLCGLYRRDYLNAADLGFALLPAARGRGVAREAALAVLDYGRRGFGLDCVLGLVAPGNARSAAVLEACAMVRLGTIQPPSRQVSDLYGPPSAAADLDTLVSSGTRLLDRVPPRTAHA